MIDVMKQLMDCPALPRGERLKAKKKEVHLLSSCIKDYAEGDCKYRDNCPTFGSRHYQCDACKAREVLAKIRELKYCHIRT